MLSTEKMLHHYSVRAVDGEAGKVHDFYFDDSNWQIRYVVVDIGDWAFDTGQWIPGQKVLISPNKLEQFDPENNLCLVQLTQDEVIHSPDIDTVKPVSQSQAVKGVGHFERPFLGSGGINFDVQSIGAPISTLDENARISVINQHQSNLESDWGDPHLRSMQAVTGYHIQALDGEVGHVDTFVIDTKAWAIRFIVIDTRNWLPGKSVTLTPDRVDRITSAESKVYIDLPKETIKNSPDLQLIISPNHE